jgi:preprotein translocase subunit SecF
MEEKTKITIAIIIFLVSIIFLSFVSSASLDVGGGVGIDITVSNNTISTNSNNTSNTNTSTTGAQTQNNAKSNGNEKNNKIVLYALPSGTNQVKNQTSTQDLSAINLVGKTESNSGKEVSYLLFSISVLLIILLILLSYVGGFDFSKTSSKTSNNKKIVSRRQ